MYYTNMYYRHDNYTLDNIDADDLKSFINGLPPELLIRVKIEGYEDLDDAFMKAIQMSKTLDSEALRRKPPFYNRHSNSSLPRQDTLHPCVFEQRSSIPNPPMQILRRAPNPFIKPLIPGKPGPNAPVGNSCRYCKSGGHLIGNCAKLQYRNSMQGHRELR